MKIAHVPHFATLAFAFLCSSYTLGNDSSVGGGARYESTYEVNLDGTMALFPHFEDWEKASQRSPGSPVRVKSFIRMSQAGILEDKIIRQVCAVVPAREFVESVKKLGQRSEFDLIYDFVIERMGFSPRTMIFCRAISNDAEIWSSLFRNRSMYKSRTLRGTNLAYSIGSGGAFFYLE